MKQLFFHKGNKFESGGSGRFAKDVIKDGNWVHPVTGKAVVVDQGRREKLAANTQRWLDSGNKIPYRDGHRNDAKANMGYWPGPVMPYGDTLVAIVEPTDSEAVGKMRDGSMADVSVVIEFDVQDSKGNKYDEVITAIDATSFPVITGQKPFIEFSRQAEARGEELYIHANSPGMSPGGDKRKETPMFKAMALALGLPEDADEAKILTALKTRDEEHKAAVTKAKAQEGLSAVKPEELAANGLEVKDGKLVKLATAPETEREKAMRLQLETLQLDRAKDKLSAAKAKADALQKAGVIPPAIAQKLSKLYALKDKVEAMALSADGKSVTGEQVDVEATLSEILSHVHGISGSRLTRLQPIAGEQKEKSAEELRKEGAALAREAQGIKETA